MVQIVAVNRADKTGWLPLWQAYLVFYDHPLADEITDLTFERMLDETVPLYMLVAKSDDAVVGFASFILHPSTWAKVGYCYLEDLFVAEAARGQGIARGLIAAVAAEAKAKGAERLYWVTDEANKTAQALYESLAIRTDFIQYRQDL